MPDSVAEQPCRGPCIVTIVAVLVGCLLLGASRWLDQPRTSESSGGGLIGLVDSVDLLQGLERATYDWRVVLASRFAPSPAPELGFVYINDETIRDIGRGETLHGSPFGLLWPRYIYGRVLRELHAQGARAVCLDVLLSEVRHDHSALWVGTNQLDSDLFFGDQIRRATNTLVILASLTNAVPSVIFRASARMGDVSLPKDVDGMARRIVVARDYVMPSKALEAYALNNGLRIQRFSPDVVWEDYDAFGWHTNKPGSDGRIEVTGPAGQRRRILPSETERVWHMGIVMAAQVLGLDLGQAKAEGDRLILPGTNGVDRVLPVDRHGRLLVDWSVGVRTGKIQEESFQKVLASDVARQAGLMSEVGTNWLGKCVVIGSTATGNNMADVGSTPLRKVDYLVGTYLNLANSIIQNRFIRRLAVGWEACLVVLLGVLAATVNWRWSPERATLGILFLALFYATVACVLFVEMRLWLPIAHPMGGGLILTHAALLTYRAFFEQRERQRVKTVFSKLVSPDVVHELLKLKHFSMGGARRQITVLFADVRGFTEMTDRRQAVAEDYVRAHGLLGVQAESFYEQEAKEVLDTVNRYLAAIAEVVKQRNGTLDKYIGDCVMAFWGAPVENPKHAVDAVLAAMDAQRAIQRLNQQRARENELRKAENQRRVASGLPPLPPIEQLSLGTGVNTGTMMVGLMGSEAHTLNYTAFGREVNLASRLEGVSGRSRIIIGEGTYRELLQQAPELAALCVMRECVQIKGFRGAVTNYEVLWRLDSTHGNAARKPPSPPTTSS